MQFESLNEFIHMGGHGVYVWTSFAVTVAVIALNIVLPVLEQKKIKVSLYKKLQRENNRK